MKSNKITLTEATVLALQGKLELEEAKEVKKESIDVSVQDDGSTIVNTEDATVIVQEQQTNTDVIPEETVECPECEEITSEEPTVEEIVDDIPLDESKKLNEEKEVKNEDVEINISEDGKEVEVTTNDGETVETIDETSTEEPQEEEIAEECKEVVEESKEDKYISELENKFGRKLTDEEIKLIKAFAPIIEADAEASKQKKTEDVSARPHHDDLLAAIEDGFVDYKSVAEACLAWLSDDDIKRMCDIYEWNIGTDELEESKPTPEPKKESKKFSSKTFNKVIEDYLKENRQDVESFKLTKFLKNESKIKIEGVITSTDKKEENVCLELKSIHAGNKYTKYELSENKSLKLESKKEESKTSMVTFLNKDNILECKYMINK